jgi:hypothetical protein
MKCPTLTPVRRTHCVRRSYRRRRDLTRGVRILAVIGLTLAASASTATAQGFSQSPEPLAGCDRAAHASHPERKRTIRAATHQVFRGLRIPLPGLREMKEGRQFEIDGFRSPDPEVACPGDRFALPVFNYATWGTIGRGGVLEPGAYFEAVVSAVSRPDGSDADGRIAFVIDHLVTPISESEEVAVSVVASIHASPEDAYRAHDTRYETGSQLAGALGNLMGGIEMDFTFQALSTLLGESMKRRTRREHGFINGTIEPDDEVGAIVVIDQTTYF